MKKGIGLLHTMAIAMAMGSGMDFPSPRRRFTEKKRRIKLGNYKHEGEIPAGCVLETETLIFFQGNFSFSIEVDVVFGSKKGKKKKLNRYKNQIQNYISTLTTKELIERKEFKVKLKNLPESNG